MAVRILTGDCRRVLPTLAANSVDAVVTDPPYELGFMGKQWDATGVAFDVSTWLAVLRVLKPGGHLLAFGGTRGFHRLAVAIEDAGFELRDCIARAHAGADCPWLAAWVYGSGFPKSLDVAKAIDSRKDWRALRQLQGLVRQHRRDRGMSQSEAARAMGLIGPADTLGGGGYMWFETGRRLPTREQYPRLKAALGLPDTCDAAFESAEREVVGQHRASAGGQNMRAGLGQEGEALPPGAITAPSTADARRWQGWGTALKPAWEPIVMARKPLEGTVAANVLEWGTGALNIDGCRVVPDAGDPVVTFDRHAGDRARDQYRTGTVAGARASDVGRFPSNLVHDGSEEVLAAFPDAPGALAAVRGDEPSATTADIFGHFTARAPSDQRDGGGSAARFFYSSKAAPSDRHEGLEHPGPQFATGRLPHDAEQVQGNGRGNHHPTVKPTELMRYLVRMVTPPGGVVLDPFAGSGSTLKAAEIEGFEAVGVELDPAYVAIARRRIAADAPLFADVSTDGAEVAP